MDVISSDIGGLRFEQASRRHWRRSCITTRHRHPGQLGRAVRRVQRHRHDHALRPGAVLGADRGRGQEFRSAPVRRQERRQEDGRLHSVRDRGVPIRHGRCFDVGNGRHGDARWRIHRVGDWRVRDHRARAPRLYSGRPSPHFAVLHSCRDHQSGRRSGVHPLRGQGTQLRNLYRVLGLGARHRRRVRDYQAERCRCDDCGRVGGGHHPDGRRWLCGDARALDAQRRPPARQPSIRQGSRRLHHGRGRRRDDPRGARVRQAARGVDLLRARWLRDVGGRVSHHRAVRGRRWRDARDAGCDQAGRDSARRRSTTSTPTARRRRSTTGSRRWPSSGRSATTRASWPFRRPSQ